MASPIDDLETKFNSATGYVQSIAGSLDKETLLQFYGFYKQATVGQCNIDKPSWYKIEACQKWNAWNQMGGMSQKEAMSQYISLLSHSRPDWETNEPREKFAWVAVSSMPCPDEFINEEDKTVFDRVKEGDVGSVLKLIKGVNVNRIDDEGMALIHWAADRGNVEMVRCLLESNADVNLKDGSGQTPLHYASACGHDGVVKLLLERGADSTIKCSEGCSPADVALGEDIRTMISSFVV